MTIINKVARLGLPAIALFVSQCVHAGPADTALEIANEARTSPLFKAEFPANQAAQFGLKTIQLDTDITLDLESYLRTSSLRTHLSTEALFQPSTWTRFLRTAPVYQEQIVQLTDRLIVERKLTVSLKAGACKQADLPREIADQCFVPKAGKIAVETQAELRQIRAQLSATPSSEVWIDGVSAAQARMLSDLQLLDLLLNRDDREMILVSEIPTRLSGRGLQHIQPGDLHRQLLPAGLLPATADRPVPGGLPSLATAATGTALAPRYFLSGFTFGRQAKDTWQHTFMRKRGRGPFSVGPYYVRLSYEFGAGFGLRLPFAVNVKASTTNIAAQDISLSVAPVNVNANGAPAYPAVGLDSSKYFGGQEFLLEVTAKCEFKASIPGPDIKMACPSIGKTFSRSFNPVIGNARRDIGYIWLPGDITGLGFTAGIGSVYVDLGVAASMSQGRIGLRVRPLENTQLSGLSNSKLRFDSANPIPFRIMPNNNSPQVGFILDAPTYGFQLNIAPAVQLRVGVDVGPYGYYENVGPYSIDSLAVHMKVTLPRHAGTVASHSYELSAGTALAGGAF